MVDFSKLTLEQLRTGLADAVTKRDQKAIKLIQDRISELEVAPEPVNKKPEEMTTGQILADYAKSAASGVPQGIEFLLNLPNYASKGIQFGLEKTLGLDPAVDRSKLPAIGQGLSQDNIARVMELATGGGIRYEPETRIGKVIQAGSAGLPAGAIGGARAAIVEGLLPAMASEVAGQATEGSSVEPYARLAAGLLTPTAIEGGRRILKTGTIDVPDVVTAQRLEDSQRLFDETGIQETVGQIAGDPNILAREAATSMGRNLNDVQLETFTSKVLEKAGIQGETIASPPVLTKRYEELGSVFDDFAEQASIPITSDLVNDFSKAIDDVEKQFAANAVPRIIEEVRDNFIALQGGNRVIDGEDFKQISKATLKLIKAEGKPDLIGLGARLNSIMQDYLERSLEAAGKTDLLNAYRTARTQYRNLDSISRSVSSGKAGQKGLVTPNSLFNVERQKIGRIGTAKGKSDLQELARMGNEMVPLPQTGTAPRRFAEEAIGGMTAAMPAGIVMGQTGDVLQTAAGMGTAGLIGGVAAATARRRNRLLGTPEGQRFLRQYLRGEGRPLASPLPLGGILSQFNQN